LIFGVGLDMIEVSRMSRTLSRTQGLKDRLFTAAEAAYCESKYRSAEHFAARFAAKEAFLKALGTGWRGGLRFNEIEIVNDDWGRPTVVVHGKVKEFCRERGIRGMHVSLSHLREMAGAVVVLEVGVEAVGLDASGTDRSGADASASGADESNLN
jgi:holo-[acyl-carrier protein] synthase